MKRKTRILIIIICTIIAVSILFACTFYFYGLTSVSKTSDKVKFTIKKGSNIKSVIADLKENNIIRSKIASNIYIKLHKDIMIQAGTYELNRNYDTKKIFSILKSGDTIKDTITVTFVEGKRITDYAEVVMEKFGINKDEFLEIANDKEYLQELINKYDILDEIILDDNIYYPLEGYLFPSTYEFYKTDTSKVIIEKMLAKSENILDNYIDAIKSSNYTVHEILTLASIVELEGARSDDREGVAGVFYNRLKSGDALGSDVTTYYAVQKDFSKPLYASELNNCNNGYNTRNNCNRGKLPVGPISSPSEESIKASLYPKEHDYYFFVADKNKKTYFAKTYSEHEKNIRELKSNGLWYEY